VNYAVNRLFFSLRGLCKFVPVWACESYFRRVFCSLFHSAVLLITLARLLMSPLHLQRFSISFI